MLLTRVFTNIGSMIIRRLGDTGGPPSPRVSQELNNIVDALSGVSTDKEILLKYNHATDPVLRVDQLGAGIIQRWLQNGTERASLSGLGKLLLPAGIGPTPSTDKISNFGTYFVDLVVRSTPASTSETDLSSKSVAANTFGNDGDFLIYITGINYAVNANTKRYRIYWGANVLFDTTAQAFNNLNEFVIGYIYRRSSSILTGMSMGFVAGGGSGTVQLTDIGSQDFTVANTFKSTGQNGAASAADIEQFGFISLKGSV